MQDRNFDKAALRGEPSYVWRAGQVRRLNLLLNAIGTRVGGTILENGCGIGMYIEHLQPYGGTIFGLEYDWERAHSAAQRLPRIFCAAGEFLPFDDAYFDVILSHEVIEHVQDDQLAIREMVRTLKVGGRLVLFCPNRGYQFETHGIYWRGKYHFGNIPLVNYLPRRWRDQLAPHVRVYTFADLNHLFAGLPIKFVERRVIFGAYDNIIARRPTLGCALRGVLQTLERTPFQILGLSHFWVVEKT